MNFMNKKILTQRGWATGIIDEIKKVSWPTKKETIRLTAIVIIISLIIGIYIGIIDVLLVKVLEILTKFR
jgi:preprotein translocase, SecE subunit, bacterial